MAQEVEVKIKVETSQAVNDVNKLGDAFDNTKTDAEEAQKAFSKAGNGVQVEQSIAGLKQLKRELKNTAVGSEEFKKIYNQIDDLEDKLKSAKNVSSDWVDSLEQAGGPLGMLGAGLNKAKVATQSFGGALKATGIGLIVSLLGGLVAAFRDNENATKKLQPLLDGIGKIFNGVFRAVEPLFNTLVDLAIGALPMVSKAFGVVYSSVTAVFQSLGMLGSSIKKLISGDFSGAWADAKSSVNDFGKNYDASIKRFNDGTKEMTKTEKDEADKRAEARRVAEEKRKAQQEKAKQDAIAKAKEEADALKAFQDDVLKNQQQMNVDKVNQDIQDKLDEKASQEERLQGISDQVDAIDALNQKSLDDKKDKAAKELEIEKQLAESKKIIQESSFAVAEGGINLLKGVFEKNKAIQKGLIVAESALGIAKIIISTQAANAADRLYAATLGPIAGPAYLGTKLTLNKVGAGIGIASNLAATSKALSTLGGGGSSGGGNAGSGGGGGSISTPQSAQPINVVGASQTNAIAQTMVQQGQIPIKAYVVANDVTTQQALTRNIVTSATIG